MRLQDKWNGREEVWYLAPECGAAGSVPANGNREMNRLKWKKNLIALFCGILLIAALEVGLRLAGVGFQPQLFVREKRDGDRWYVTNPAVGRRFFSASEAREPIFGAFPAEKPGNVRRIFIVGESAAMGFPAESFAFGNLLRAMLSLQYPELKFEVLYAALTGVDSNALVVFAREIADYEPDLVVVYSGNNELIGPYGPLQPLNQPWMIGFDQWLRSMRIGQTVRGLADRIAGRGTGPQSVWTGMAKLEKARIHPDDLRITACEQRFERNLAEIRTAVERSGAPLILCTVPRNLRDCPPFASLSDPNLSPEQLQQWQQLYDSGSAGDALAEDALTALNAAVAIDPSHALTRFLRAKLLEQAGDALAARDEYSAACDADALPFRPREAINAAVRKTAAAKTQQKTELLDLEQQFWQIAEGCAPGLDLFYEHVHLNTAGNMAIARQLFQLIQQRGLLHLPVVSQDQAAAPSEDAVKDFVVLERRDELSAYNRVLDLMARPPFAGQPQFHPTLTNIVGLRNALIPQADDISSDELIGKFRRAMSADPENIDLGARLSQLLLELGDVAGAERELRRLMDKMPKQPSPKNNFALVRLAAGAVDEAIGLWTEQLKDKDTPIEVRNNIRENLTRALALSGVPGQADALIDAIALDPRDARIWRARWMAAFGEHQLKNGQLDAALDSLLRAAEFEPDHEKHLINSGRVLVQLMRPDEAHARFAAAVEANPASPEAQTWLGISFREKGDSAAAISHLHQALLFDPLYRDAYDALGHMYESDGRTTDAIDAFKMCINLSLMDPNGYLNLARVTGTGGNYASAAGILESGYYITEDPELAKALTWIFTDGPDAALHNAERAAFWAERAALAK